MSRELNREKLLNMATTPEEREVVARVIDLGEMAIKNRAPRVTGFYDPYRIHLVTRVVNSIPGLSVGVDGGYPVAERSRALIFPGNLDQEELDFGLAFIEIKGNFRFARVTHRDYLGALLGLGIQRDKLGDILVGEDGARVVVASEVAGYITGGLASVGRTRVSVREIQREELDPPAPRVKEIKATVQSLRLDALAAQGFGLSRSKIAREITASKVYLNWRPCQDPSARVDPGDVISVRGRGRVEVVDTAGKTKKGRTSVILKRFL